MSLPHRFPFRWIERVGEGRARALLSANSTWLRGAAPLPASFLAELVAQAAALLLEDPADDPGAPRERWLAGIERLEMRRTVHAGDLLEISVVAGRRFGSTMRVEGLVAIDGETVAEVALLLV